MKVDPQEPELLPSEQAKEAAHEILLLIHRKYLTVNRGEKDDFQGGKQIAAIIDRHFATRSTTPIAVEEVEQDQQAVKAQGSVSGSRSGLLKTSEGE